MTSTMNLTAVKNSYSLYSFKPIYYITFGAALQPGRLALAQKIKTINPSSLLEVGVGTGLLLPLYPKTTQVHGIDISPAMLSKAHALVHKKSLTNTTLLSYDGQKLPFDDNQFDCVTIPYVYSVTPDPLSFIAECFRVCKPGGNVFILNHFSNTPEKNIWRGLELLAKPFANLIGFDSDFDYHQYITQLNMPIVSVSSINLFKLSRLVHVKKN